MKLPRSTVHDTFFSWNISDFFNHLNLIILFESGCLKYSGNFNSRFRHCRDAPYYKVELLDFCEDDPTTFLECDVLIGCEVVFDPAVVSGLGRFIKAFLNKDSSKSCHIICTVRNEGTFKCFIEELENLQLKNSIIDISSKESVIMICTIVDTSWRWCLGEVFELSFIDG